MLIFAGPPRGPAEAAVGCEPDTPAPTAPTGPSPSPPPLPAGHPVPLPGVPIAPSPPRAAADDPPAPTHIGPYRVLRRIASGGMGTVYECHDERLDKRVAVKVAHPRLARQPDALDAIRDEGRRLASVRDDTHLIRVLAAGDAAVADARAGEAVVPWIAMEFAADAEPLGGPVSNAWPVERKVAALAKLCRAVEALHAQHLVHADIKPDNVLVVEGEPRLIDFGIARVVRRLGGEPGQHVAGTPGYFDPAFECTPDAAPDQRSDVYCLGLTAAGFLARRNPSRGWPSPSHPPSDDAPWIDAELDEALLRATDPDPAKRFQSAADFRAALERWLAFRGGAPARAARRLAAGWGGLSLAARRWPLTALALVAAIAGLVALGVSAAAWRWTPLPAWTQRLTPAPVAGAPLDRVGVIEMRDQAAFVAAAREAGARIAPGGGASVRPAWAALARRLARTGGARVVGFDLFFSTTTPDDADLADALAELARSSESGVVVLGMSAWDMPIAPALTATGAVRAGAALVRGAEGGHPAIEQLAARRSGSTLALPSFPLLLAACAHRPGWEPQVEVDQADNRVTVRFVRRDPSGAWVGGGSDLTCTGQQVVRRGPDSRDGPGLGDDDLVVNTPVEPAPPEALARASLDAAVALRMPVEDLRQWLLGRAVVVYNEVGEPRFEAGAGKVPGALLHASAVGALLSGRFLRSPGVGQAAGMTVAAAAVGGLLGLVGAAAASRRARGVRWTALAAALAIAVVAAGYGCLWIGGSLRYFVNPAGVMLAAVLGCAAMHSLRCAPARTA